MSGLILNLTGQILSHAENNATSFSTETFSTETVEKQAPNPSTDPTFMV
jgi:hypothetical protein